MRIVRDIIHFTRIQTATGEALMYLLAFLWGSSTVDWGTTGMIFGWAVLAHCASFAHNNVMDYRLGYDQKDPHKQDSPLVEKRWSINICHWITLCTQLFLGGFMAWWLATNAVHPAEAIVGLMGYIVFGFSYNDGLGKGSRVGSGTAVATHLCLVSCFWFVRHGWTLDIVALMVIVGVGLWVLYFIQGQMKDRDNSEEGVGLIIRLFPIVDDHVVPTRAGMAWVTVPVALWLLALIWVTRVNEPGIFPVLTWVGVNMAVLMILIWVVEKREWKRSREVFLFALLYLLIILGAMVITAPLIIAAAGLGAGFANYIVINRLAWGQNTPGI